MVIEARNSSTFLDRIITLSLSWRISRMMLIDEHGGFKDEHGNLLSFINFQKLSELTTHSEGYFHPLQEKILKATFTLLSHGVGAIGLCRMADLHRELFTYEGNGTFFSCRHYCEVRELSWDDFPRVAALIHQGVKEGYLLPRSEEQISKILLNGFGAFISGQHLAGVCGLFTEGYEKEKAGEVVALYALTRFQGEGIGARLIQQLKEESEKKGLNILFACTQQTKVMEFFQRQNFVPVEASAIPSAKWRSYDMERKKSAHCFIYDLKGN
ncbi:MAG TPA: GNAT family N-acetyltransferase [Magnetococcales bacterium]|nr:GNAT family N-acetyltransferase [Magnetococcales bacterium]